MKGIYTVLVLLIALIYTASASAQEVTTNRGSDSNGEIFNDVSLKCLNLIVSHYNRES